MSERGEQQSCLTEENNNHVRDRGTTIMYERGEQQSFLREENSNHDCSSSLSDMIDVLCLRHDYCSPLSDMIVVLLSQT
jgi:hypothetical protein